MEADAPSLDALARLAAECLATADRGPFILRVDRARDCAALVDGSGESCIADVHDAEGSAPLLAASWSLARGLVAAVDALRAERAQRDAERLAIADALELQPIATHEQCVSAARVLSGALTNALDTLGAQSRLLEAKHTPEDGVSLLVSAVLGFADDAPNSVEFCGTWLGRRFHLTVQWTDGQTPGEMLTEMQGERDAAIARATAADDRRDALAAAVREERAAREAVPEGFDADYAGADERARVYALWDAVEAAQKRLDALLSGAAPDVVRAGVVRDFLRAHDRVPWAVFCDGPQLEREAEARAALDAALAAVKETP